MPVRSINDSLVTDGVAIADGRVQLRDEAVLASPYMDTLVRHAVFGDALLRAQARWMIWELGQQVGVRAGSIHDLVTDNFGINRVFSTACRPRCRTALRPLGSRTPRFVELVTAARGRLQVPAARPYKPAGH